MRSGGAAVVAIAFALISSGCSSSSSSVAATSATGAGTVASTSVGAATTPASTSAGATTTSAAASATTIAAASNASIADIVTAATTFVSLLDSTEKSAGLFEYSNTTQKAKWSNFPNSIFPRSGLQWANLTEAEQNAWLAMVQKSLSTEGYNRFLAEWKADDALAASEGGNAMFGSKLFYIALMGTPSATSPWMWQFGGHHVTQNVTIAGGRISPTPSFVGDQPTSYTDATGKTVVPLGDISDDVRADGSRRLGLLPRHRPDRGHRVLASRRRAQRHRDHRSAHPHPRDLS